MPNFFVWRAVLFVSLGAVISGYYDGSMNGILEMRGFQRTFHHVYENHEDSYNGSSYNNNSSDGDNGTDATCSSGNGASSDIIIGMLVAISALGSVGGSLLAGWLSDQFSRKYGLLISGLVMMVGSCILSSSFNIWCFVVGRGVNGIAVGIIYMVMPVYISEVSPKESRGMLTSLIGIGYAMGALLGLCTNIGFSRFLLGWRVATGVQAVWGLLFSLGMVWMPYTPRWLVVKRRDKEAHLILSKINGHSGEDKCQCVDTHFELEELKEAARGSQVSLKEALKWKYMSRLLLMLAMFFIYAATGNFLYFFSATLFCGIGVKPFISALAVGGIMWIASIMLPFFIDKVGRKVSLLCGSAVCTVLAGTAATLRLLFGTSNEVVMFLIVAIICAYAFTNSCTWLTIPFIINSEIFPVNIRGLTVAVTIGGFWLFSFVINQIIPTILGSSIQIHGFFFIVAGVNFLAIILVAVALPETKGVSLEQMDELFSNSCMQSITKAQCLSCCEGDDKVQATAYQNKAEAETEKNEADTEENEAETEKNKAETEEKNGVK